MLYMSQKGPSCNPNPNPNPVHKKLSMIHGVCDTKSMVHNGFVTYRDCDTKATVHNGFVTYRDCDAKATVHNGLVTYRTL